VVIALIYGGKPILLGAKEANLGVRAITPTAVRLMASRQPGKATGVEMETIGPRYSAKCSFRV